MVALDTIRSSNASISKTVRPGLVAVFAGATAGIGESSLQHFAKNTVRPKIYFIGRSKESGSRVSEELKKLNPDGEYIFMSVDVSLLASVDEACRKIKERESTINVLFLSTGTMLPGKDTEEGLNYPAAVSYYARLRFLVNLLPLLQNADGLRRVVSVFAGTKEGSIKTADMQGRKGHILTLVGHFSTMMTFALEAVAKTAPTVSFVHAYPGFVKTKIGYDVKGTMFTILRGVYDVIYPVIGPFMATPVSEAGERQIFFATSARFPEADGTSTAGVPCPKDVVVAKGTNGKTGSGVYSVTNDGESAPAKVEQLLAKLRKEGLDKTVWTQLESEFVRITGTASV